MSRGRYDQGCPQGCETGGPHEMMEGAVPTPDEAVMPEGTTGQEEFLPAPRDARPTNAPPLNSSGSARLKNEHPATNPPDPVVANARV
jgi:hypothetical protein